MVSHNVGQFVGSSVGMGLRTSGRSDDTKITLLAQALSSDMPFVVLRVGECFPSGESRRVGGAVQVASLCSPLFFSLCSRLIVGLEPSSGY